MKNDDSIKKKSKRGKNSSRRRWVDFAIYCGALIVLIAVVVAGYRPDAQSVDSGQDASANTTKPTVVVEIDPAKAIEYANKAAIKADLAVAPSVSEQATSSRVLAMVDRGVTVGSNEYDDDEIRTTSAIAKYTVKEGDTLDSIAMRFDVSNQTVQWANKLKDANVSVGAELVIPVVDGVVYTVRDGDNLSRVVDKYKSNIDIVLSINNIEEGAVVSGVQLILPGGILPENERPGYVPPVVRPVNPGGYGQSIAGWRAPSVPLMPGNTFYYGNCTWYAYNRRIQLGLRMDGITGNANAWAWTARNAGYLVNNTPAVGAIMQSMSGAYGHVAIVEAINDDGTITISEMNNRAYGGFGITNYNKISNPYSYTYIH